MNRRIEPGLLIIFRYYSAVAVAYFAIIITIAMTQGGSLSAPIQHWSTLNLLLFAFLFVYLAWPWLQKKMGKWYLPAALALAVAVPCMSNFFDYFLPSQRTLTILITRSWMLFPILIVPLVLISWQYEFKFVLLLIILSTLQDEAMLLPAIQTMTLDNLIVVGQPLIRAFAFGTIGHIVSHLLQVQRAQQRVLLRANMELSQHSKTLEQLAVSRERNRIARDLHDTLAHTLSGLAVKLEAVKTTLDPSQTEMTNEIDESLTVIREGLKETRRVLKDLRPRALEELGLAAAITNLSVAVSERANFKLKTQISDITQLPPDTEVNIYRIAQEALENAALHSNAKEVSIRLAQSDQRVTLAIQDDGIGFDQSAGAVSEQSYGIKGMQERAILMGGKLAISSGPAGGTLLELTLDF